MGLANSLVRNGGHIMAGCNGREELAHMTAYVQDSEHLRITL